jgi:L-iditol 2-dehydrogenase/threonine 3-dehydrogenase
LHDLRLEVARNCGVPHTSNAADEPLAEGATRAFGSDGFDAVFDCAGAGTALKQALEAIDKGGVIVLVAVHTEERRLNVAFVQEWELAIIGSLMYKHEDYVEAVNMISTGDIVTEPLVSEHFPLQQYEEAYRFIEREGARNIKVMIDL